MNARTGKLSRRNVNHTIVVACLLVLLIAVYSQGLSGPFLLDDLGSVTPITLETLSFGEIIRVSTGDASGIWGRSLPVMTFALNDFFGGAGTFSYKATNLFIHALTAILIFKFLSTVFKLLNRTQNSFSDIEIRYLALFVTSVWALHPLQVSTVLYVVQRMAMLSTLFTTITLLAYISLRTKTHTSLSSFALMILALVSTVAACLSKESGVLILPYILLLEFSILQPREPCGKLHAKSKSTLSIVTFSLAAIATIAMLVLSDSIFSGYVVRDYGIWERLITQLGVLSMYLKIILLPNLADMSLYRDAFPVQRSVNAQVVIPMFLIITLAAIAIFWRRKFPIILFGLGLFLIAHSLESTIFPLELVFEHRNYFALLGIVAAVSWMALALIKSSESHLPAFAAGIGIVFFFGFQTHLRSIEWGSADSYHRQALIRTPDSIRALNTWTTHLAAKGEMNEVLSHLHHSHQVRPDSPHFLVQLLMFTGALVGPDEQLFTYVKTQLQTMPFKSEEVATLGEMLKYSTEGRFDWPSRSHITELYAVATSHSNQYLKRPTESLLQERYSDLLKESGQTVAALSAISRSVELDPNEPMPLIKLADLHIDTGDNESASEILLQLETLDSTDIFSKQRMSVASRLAKTVTAESE